MLHQIELPCIATARCRLKLLEPHQAEIMTRFRVANRLHLAQWEPTRSIEFFTSGYWEIQLRRALQDFRQGNSVCLAITDPVETEVFGVCNFTQIVRGTFMSCHLGYALAQRYEGQGIMFEALQASLRYIFEDLRLHRVMANYMPRNQRSGALLQRLGFKIEGHAEKFLKIDGRWEDHVLTSLINPWD
jgi:[ribosomal protein S5]-alanine N-acetyltransferase